MAEPAGGLQVFILGPPRSGTSILYFALGDVFNLDGTGESHVMPVFVEMDERWSSHVARFQGRNVLASRLDPGLYRRQMLGAVREFYATQFPSGHWVDKTPGIIAGVPFMLAAFPRARLLLTRRTGVEVVASHLAKFRMPFAAAARQWRRSMEGLLAVRSLPAELRAHVLEQDQFDLTNAAAASGERIAAHLGRPDKAADLARYFLDRRVQQTSRHRWDSRLTLADTGWSEADKQVFAAECGPMMAELGYPM